MRKDYKVDKHIRWYKYLEEQRKKDRAEVLKEYQREYNQQPRVKEMMRKAKKKYRERKKKEKEAMKSG